MTISRFTTLFLLVAMIAPARFAAADTVAMKMVGKQEVITLTLPQKGDYKVFTLADPDRLVIDVPALRPPVKVSMPEGYAGKLVHTVRYGQFDPTTSRFVFEMNGEIKVQETLEEGDKPFRLVVTIVAAGELKPKPKQEVAENPKPPVGGKSKGKEPEPVAKKTPAKPLIVIDAGHGGVDPGAIGVGGIYEKDLTLDYARTLQDMLLRTGRYRVAMTREGDQFILLRKRVQMAREAAGSLFVSIHADSAPEVQARGLSVYTLSEKSSDKEAEALAERENKADIIANVDLSNESEDVAGILISLAQRETKNQSAMFADLLVLNVSKNVATLPNPHRFAGFAVLKAPDIPSVLVELGFLSNPAEAKKLADPKHREKVIRGLVKGMDAYFTKKREGF